MLQVNTHTCVPFFPLVHVHVQCVLHMLHISICIYMYMCMLLQLHVVFRMCMLNVYTHVHAGTVTARQWWRNSPDLRGKSWKTNITYLDGQPSTDRDMMHLPLNATHTTHPTSHVPQISMHVHCTTIYVIWCLRRLSLSHVRSETGIHSEDKCSC